VVEAIGARDAAAAFAAVDRVIQTGQDPRRFVEDLLERLRDLIIVAATGGGAAAVLRGIQQDELDRMAGEAALFGVAELSRAADVVNAALTEMTGATSPRLHLELLIARVLLPSSDDTERGTLARVERLERRIGVATDGGGERPVTPPAAVPAAATVQTQVPAGAKKAAAVPVAPSASPSSSDATPAASPAVPAVPTVPAVPAGPPVAAGPVTLQQVKDAWPEILKVVEDAKRTAWMVLATARPRELRDNNVLVLTFPSQKDVDGLKERSVPGQGIGDYLKQATFQVLGIRPGLLAKVDPKPTDAPGNPTPHDSPRGDSQPDEPGPDDIGRPPEPTEPDIEPAPPEVDGTTWYTAPVPDSAGSAPATANTGTRNRKTASAKAAPAKATPAATRVTKAAQPEPAQPDAGQAAPATPAAETRTSTPAAPRETHPALQPRQRYGESVVREILGASFIEEQTIEPAVTPKEF
jgi:DNA polymerase III subunit gamma/tau